MFQRDDVIEVGDKVGRDLNTGDVDDDGFGGLARFRGSGVVERHDPEPVHDAVEDVAQRALGLVALDEGDLDPRARLDVQHLHAVA